MNITVLIQVLKWDARSKMIDHDNCYHSGVEMRCEISNDWSIIVVIQVLKWDVRSKMIAKLNVSLLSLKPLYTYIPVVPHKAVAEVSRIGDV